MTGERLEPDEIDERLESLAAELAARGLDDDARELRSIEDEWDQLERPAGLIGRLGQSVGRHARRQWRFVRNELRESVEAWSLLQRRVVGRETLTPEERDAVRAQLLDTLRCIPAGVLTAATLVAPVPGVALASPWMLRRLGLLPSSWREAHVLARLRAERDRLERRGQTDAADDVEAVIDAVEERARERERLERECPLLVRWDADGDGTIDAAEQAVYDDEVRRLAAQVGGGRRGWFVRVGDAIFGPLRWSDVPTSHRSSDALRVLVCDGEGAWVSLDHVLAALEQEG